MEPFLGQIQMFGFNFPPRGWAHCNGQLLPIAQNQALFSLLGTTFGGDGRTTFGLPDLRGRAAIHVGTGPGLNPVQWGERSGAERVQLTSQSLPSHSHTGRVRASGNPADTNNPTANAPGLAEAYSSQDPSVDMRDGTVQTNNTGGGQAFSIRNPLLGIYHSIAMTGIYPSRN